MHDPSQELFEIVDDQDRVVGTARRCDCHGNPALIHRTAHVMVFDRAGRMLLQKRAASKDIQPGRWDTAVGGHLRPGESYEQAARREMAEEVGLDPALPLRQLFDARIRNDIEAENTRVFAVTHEGPFRAQAEEIDALRFWSPAEVTQALGTGIFTPNLEAEIATLRDRGLW